MLVILLVILEIKKKQKTIKQQNKSRNYNRAS